MATATIQDQYLDIANRSQQTISAALRTWTDSFQNATTGLVNGQPQLPKPQDFVDQVYDFAEQVLANQRELAHNLLALGAQSTDAAVNAINESAAPKK